jgi:adenylosuccinate synthase
VVADHSLQNFDEDGATMAQWDEFGFDWEEDKDGGWLDLVALKYAVQVNGVTTNDERRCTFWF